ncbi:hypothetical protein PBI_PERCIVAL_24 [Microbacterium phage Percival]|uniref:PID domain-containing protein n=1 Tax=Microbacterium phage Percival TaxID=2201439 RepID=A0A2Z4Q6L4_9CAUD|nr:hypothetical protein PBI_PERCIVAL_24 [Microbacterium phage Percival]
MREAFTRCIVVYMTSTEYPTAPATVVFSRNFADIYAAASERDQRHMTESSELGYGFLSSSFDSEAASNASAAMCHFFHAQKEGATEEDIAYHLRLASSFASMALA